MRTILLANNRLGARVGRFLHDRADLFGIVLHPSARQKHVTELGGLGVPVWTWPHGLAEAQQIQPECLLSVLFAYRIPSEWLSVPIWNALNLHPGLLPWNRGACPNVWPLVDGSPAGTTLHVMEADIDTGAIIAQDAVPCYPTDTAESLYERLEDASLALLVRVWPDIRGIQPTRQAGGGSHHRMADLVSLDLHEDELPVLDRLRARTFPPYGAEFERDGHRYRVRVEIEKVD